MSRSDLHDAAREYAERGWPVFPLIPRDKRPITSDGFKSATVDLRQIDQWWLSRPSANIGLPTGIAFDVLDIDGPVGMEHLRNYPGVGAYRHAGPVSVTGKGWHLLFAPTGRKNGADLLLNESKLDFRGIGGYICAAPSVHPLGHSYAWDPSRGPDAALPAAPQWLFDLLDHRGIAEYENKTDRKVPIPSDPTRSYLEQVNAIMPEQLPRDLRLRFSRPDILEVAEEKGMVLRRRGKYYETLCVYHQEDTPSMALYPSNNTWYCYGCGHHGDSKDLREGTFLR